MFSHSFINNVSFQIISTEAAEGSQGLVGILGEVVGDKVAVLDTLVEEDIVAAGGRLGIPEGEGRHSKPAGDMQGSQQEADLVEGMQDWLEAEDTRDWREGSGTPHRGCILLAWECRADRALAWWVVLGRGEVRGLLHRGWVLQLLQQGQYCCLRVLPLQGEEV